MQYFHPFRARFYPLPIRRYTRETNDRVSSSRVAPKSPSHPFERGFKSPQQSWNRYMQGDAQYVPTAATIRRFKTLFFHPVRLARHSTPYQRSFANSTLSRSFKASSNRCQSISKSPFAVCAPPNLTNALLQTTSKPHFIRYYTLGDTVSSYSICNQ